MTQPYFEIRSSLPLASQSIAANIARHLQSRQYLGNAMVVTNHPLAMLSACRKQWLRLSRNLQKQRASTLNAEEILRFTHSIMHMQNMRFLAKPPDEHVAAEVHFVTPDEFKQLPTNCFTLYVAVPIKPSLLDARLFAMPRSGVVVGYYDAAQDFAKLGLRPKQKLEAKVLKAWESLENFLGALCIYPPNLMAVHGMQSAAMDEALDTLLTMSVEFLHQAAIFQHAMDLAQPLNNFTSEQHRLFETVTRLAYRVQSLSPGSFGNYLGTSFGDSDAMGFFLRDAAPEADDLL